MRAYVRDQRFTFELPETLSALFSASRAIAFTIRENDIRVNENRSTVTR